MSASLVKWKPRAKALVDPDIICYEKKRCYSCRQPIRRKCQWHRQNEAPSMFDGWSRFSIQLDTGRQEVWCSACGAAWRRERDATKWTKIKRRPDGQ